MDNDTNLESLFDDVFSGTQEAPAGDDGQQKEETPAEEDKQQEAAQEPQEQSRDERAAQAAARREREERERRREQRAYQTARQEMSSLIRELGISDPDKGTPIDSVDALEAYAKALREERLNAGNPTGDDIKQIVREELQSAQRQTQAQTPAQTQKASDNRLVQEQLAQIKAMDPAMTDLKSILESEAGPKFREYVSKGLDFVDAYKLAAEKRLAGIQTNRQGARTGGKDHLTSTKTAGSGDIDVPQETRDMYKLLMPEMSEAEIQKAYNADRKRFGG